MNFDLLSDPSFGVFAFYVIAPPILAMFLVIKPLRKLANGMLFAVLGLPIMLGGLVVGLTIFLLLTADLFFRSQSITALVFGADFSLFEESIRSNSLSDLDDQFGPFNYFGLMENPCLLDYYSEEELGGIPNMLLGGIQKIACYSDWRVGNSDEERVENLIEDFLNEDLNSIRTDLSVNDLSEVSLLELPKLVMVNSPDTCTAQANYNVEVDFNGVPTTVSISDYYNFEEINPTQSVIPWNSEHLSGYTCNDHCFTRRLTVDLSRITTPLNYYEFAKRYFSDDAVAQRNNADTEVDRATELLMISRSELEEEVLASRQFQNWLYLRNQKDEEMLFEELARLEINFEEISEGASRTWNERIWEHPYLFDEHDIRVIFRPEWEQSLSVFEPRNERSSLFLRDDVVYYLTANKNLMDAVIQYCSTLPLAVRELGVLDGLEEPLIVTVSAEGAVHIGITQIPRSSLYERLRLLATERNSDIIFLRADGSQSSGAIQELVDTLDAAGFSDVRMVVDNN